MTKSGKLYSASFLLLLAANIAFLADIGKKVTCHFKDFTNAF
jgi:hypothetical protein